MSRTWAGQAVLCRIDSTTIVAGAWKKEAIAGRCAEIRRQIEETTSDYDKEKLRERLVRLSGGVALLSAASPVEAAEKDCDGDERTGVRILKRALEAPARQIAENSGADAGVVVDTLRAANGTVGFDAALNRYTDLVASGIIDPTKVVRVALENAVPVANTLLLTDATMTDIPEKHRAAAAAGDHEIE